MMKMHPQKHRDNEKTDEDTGRRLDNPEVQSTSPRLSPSSATVTGRQKNRQLSKGGTRNAV
ncbi:hypothetical protein EON65_16170 [archaeon]|nr:MAG: hypothetical protein EON65_16170 [archaeon]